MFEHEILFQVTGVVLATEQSIKSFTFVFQSVCLNFKSTFTIFKEFINDLGEHLMMAVSPNMFYTTLTVRIKRI